MRFKNIQIILPFVSYAFVALSSPIFNSNKLDIDEYIPNDKPINQKLLMVRNKISEEEEEETLSPVENSDEEVTLESDEELKEIDSDPESEVETDNSNDIDDKFSDEDYLSINWNRTPEELGSIIDKEFENLMMVIAQIESIPDEECSFESVIVPLEQKFFGPVFEKIVPYISMDGFHPDESIRNISADIYSKFMFSQMTLILNKNIYHKILMVKENIKNGLFDEPKEVKDKRLIDVYELNFRRNGIDVPDEHAEEYMGITSELGGIAAQFNKCLFTENIILSFKKDELEGLPSLDNFEKTEEDGEEVYKISIQDPNHKDVILYAKNENTRKRVQLAEFEICPSNVDLLKKAVNLKLKKAKILGYPSHANYQLENRMAENPENVFKFLEDLKEKTKPAYNKQLKRFLELKKKDKDEINEPFDNKLNYWDLDYYSRIYDEENSGINNDEFKKYFPFNEVLKETLDLFETIYSIKFVEVKNPSVWSPDVRVFNVYDKLTKKLMGPIYLDLFKRLAKQDGFTTSFSPRYQREDGSYCIPSAAVFLGFAPQQLPDKPTLMDHGDIIALFHELGHSIHFVSSNVKWPTYNPSNIEFEFAEVPSQLNENWTWEPEVLTKLSHYYQDTSKKIPQELINNLIKTKNIDKPKNTLFSEFLSMADMKIHSITEEDENLDVVKIFNEAMKDALDIELDNDILMITTVSHFISGYDAGYYSYLWSEVYSTDIFYSQFKKNGIFNSEIGERYRKVVLEKTSSEKAMDYLTEFLGREPNDEAFIKSITSEN